jgi:hypothetical protein
MTTASSPPRNTFLRTNTALPLRDPELRSPKNCTARVANLPTTVLPDVRRIQIPRNARSSSRQMVACHHGAVGNRQRSRRRKAGRGKPNGLVCSRRRFQGPQGERKPRFHTEPWNRRDQAQATPTRGIPNQDPTIPAPAQATHIQGNPNNEPKSRAERTVYSWAGAIGGCRLHLELQGRALSVPALRAECHRRLRHPRSSYMGRVLRSLLGLSLGFYIAIWMRKTAQKEKRRSHIPLCQRFLRGGGR